MFKKIILLCLMVLTTCVFVPNAYAYTTSGALFAVTGDTSYVTAEIYSEWRRQAKLAYFYPTYDLKDAQKSVIAEVTKGQQLNKLTTDTFRSLAQRTGAKAIVLVAIDYLDDEQLLHWGNPFREDAGEDMSRVTVYADLYVYRQDRDKLLHKKLRSREITATPVRELPEKVVQYALFNLISEMEGREKI